MLEILIELFNGNKTSINKSARETNIWWFRVQYMEFKACTMQNCFGRFFFYRFFN